MPLFLVQNVQNAIIFYKNVYYIYAISGLLVQSLDLRVC